MRRGLRLRTVGMITAACAVVSAGFRAALWQHEVGHANFAFFYLKVTARPEVLFQYPGSSGRLFTVDMVNHLRTVWNRIYFGSDTQADALLVGCFTAIVLFWLVPRLRARDRKRLMVAGGLGLIVSAGIVAHAYSRFSSWLPQWGFFVFAVSIAALVAALVVAPRGLLARAFAFAPLVWVGRRSYAIYLFHQLLFSQLQRSRVDLPAPVSFLFQIVAVLVAAELSYRIVEAPMLRRKRRFAAN